MPGVLLVGKGSECLGLMFVSLDIVRSRQRCRRGLLRGKSCGLSFLIPCGRASINNQSKCTTGDRWLTYFRLLAPSVAAQLFGCFVLLDAGPYRLEGGGVTSGFILPLGLIDGGGQNGVGDEGASLGKECRSCNNH